MIYIVLAYRGLRFTALFLPPVGNKKPEGKAPSGFYI